VVLAGAGWFLEAHAISEGHCARDVPKVGMFSKDGDSLVVQCLLMVAKCAEQKGRKGILPMAESSVSNLLIGVRWMRVLSGIVFVDDTELDVARHATLIDWANAHSMGGILVVVAVLSPGGPLPVNGRNLGNNK
jgi:hypothetical protein